MAIPFEPLSTEKLKIYFKKMIETNCNNQETDQRYKNVTNKPCKIPGIKRRQLSHVKKTWIQREINS